MFQVHGEGQLPSTYENFAAVVVMAGQVFSCTIQGGTGSGSHPIAAILDIAKPQLTMGDQIATRNSRAVIIILTALLVGTLDLSAAFTDYFISSGKNPVPVVSKYIASGVFGTDAFSGGTGMVILGILFHYFIASSFAVFFFLLYTRTNILPKNKFLTAILYGIFMWIVTVLIILPMSNVPPRRPLEFWKVTKAISILVVMIGIPLVLIAGKYFRRKDDPQVATA